MENVIFGIITIAIVSFIYYLSYRKHQENRDAYAIILIMLGGLLLRIYTSCDFFLHAWDERYHALVAKNLISNPYVPLLYKTPLLDYNFKIWTVNHVWLHKQPFPLYSMALSMFIFGKNVIALRLPSILLSTAMIFSTYKIGEYLSSRKVGLLAAFLCSFHGLLIEQTAGRVTTDHIDVFFFSLISIAIFLFLKSTKTRSYSYLVLGGIVTGLAILSKWLPALIVFPIYVIYSYKKLNNKELCIKLLLAIFITFLVAAPWQYYILTHFPLEAQWEYDYNTRHIYEALELHNKPWYFHFDMMRIIFGELIYIPLIWLIYSALKDLKNSLYHKSLLVVWILVPYIFFTIAATKMQGYILFCAPAIFIMTSLFYHQLKESKFQYVWLKRIILALLILLPMRYAIERIKPFDKMERTAEWITNIKKFEEENIDKKTVIFNNKFAIETMFHTDIITYEHLPDVMELKKLDSQGYQIVIDNFKPLGEAHKNLPFVKYTYITGTKNAK